LAVTDEQSRIIEVKYKGPQICTMQSGEVHIWSQALLLKIHIITGWIIPDEQVKMDILIEQFEKHLTESYGMLNIEEIEYAFRSFGTTIEDWGKQMNLNLTDKVLLPYLQKRLDASEVERKNKSQPMQQRIYTDEEILNERRCEIELSYQAMRNGYYPLIHVYFGQILKEDNFIKEENEISEFFSYCLNNNIERIYEKL
jgi:hypothetical protein